PGLHGHVDLFKEGTRWDLRALNLAAGGGKAQGQGQVDLGGVRPWKGFIRWGSLGRLGRAMSGEAHFSGGGGVPGRIVVSPWSVAGSALPIFGASLDLGPEGLRRAEGNLGPNLSWTLLAGNKPLWRLRAELQGFDPGPFAGLLVGRHSHAGSIRLNGLAQATFNASQPLAASLDLGETGGARLKGRCDWVSGTASLRATFRSLDLARLAREVKPLGWSLPPLGGSADGSLSGTGEALTMSASVTHFSWDKQDLGPLALNLEWDKNSLGIPLATVGTDSGPMLSLAQVRWRGSARSWSVSGGVSVTAWPVGVWSLGGSALVRASGGGSKLEWKARFKPLILGLRSWPDCALEGSWNGGHYSLREAVRSPRFIASGSYVGGVFSLDHLRARSGGGLGTLSGRMGADSSLDFIAQSKGFPASDLAQFMGWPQDWAGSSWGTVRVSGSVDKPHTVVSAKVEDGSVDGLPFDLGTGTVVQDGEWVDLSPSLPIRLTRRDGTVLEVGGRVPLDYRPNSGEDMDVWAALRGGGLGLFSGLPAIFHAQGPLSLKLRFRGDPNNPRVDGNFAVMDGSLDPAWLLPKLQGVRILAQIEDSKVSFPEAEARASGDGRMLWVRATDPSKPAFVFRDWLPSDLNLSLSSGRAGLPLRNTRALGFISGVAHPDLTVSGSWDAPLLGGSVLLERGNADKALIQWPPLFQAGNSDTGGWFSRVGYHLILKARSDVMVRTDAAEVFVDTGGKGVLVEGSGADKRLYGHLRLVQGSVDYLLATFQLAPDHESWLEMRGDAAPQLELWGLDDLGNVSLAGAAGASEDVQILLHAWGPIGQVQMRLLDQDDPSLTQNQLAGLIGVGGDSGDPRSQGGFTRMLGSVPAALISKWARKTGLLDEVNFSVPALDQAMAPTPVAGDATGQVQPLSQATPTSGTARSLLEVSAGRYLGSKLFVGVDTQVIQRSVVGGSQINPELGGVIEYSLPNHARLSAERNIDSSGVTDSRVMLEDTSHFDNYNPDQRRWDGSPTATPGPAPLPSPSPTPGGP
ncbi:MAG: translocation/assembly module TamB domain-containing protein, partial [bacterium]